jgi:hypothetical protein
VSVCAGCAVAVARFVTDASDAVVLRLWKAPAAPVPVIDVDEVLAQFKAGIRATVRDDDAATHHALGVAYKEMGLADEAARELDVAHAAQASAETDLLRVITLDEAGRAFDAIRAAASFVVAHRRTDEAVLAVLLKRLVDVDAVREALFVD